MSLSPWERQGGAEPARGSAQPPGSLLPAPEDAPGSINPPPCSHSQRQSQRATLSSWGAPGRGPPLWGPGNHRPPGVPTVQRQGGPVRPGRGPCPKAGSWPQVPRLALPTADQAPRYSCTLQLETNLPVTAPLQGSKGRDESILSTFTAVRSRRAQPSSPIQPAAACGGFAPSGGAHFPSTSIVSGPGGQNPRPLGSSF